MAEVVISEKEEWVNTAAALFIDRAAANIADHGYFSVALAGGGTPAPLYAALASPENRDRVQWEKIHLFWGDERHVPANDSQSNYRLVKEDLLDAVPIPDTNIHRVRTEMDVRLAAFAYEEDLRQFFHGDWPRFDLVLLGMGEDGHTASLFPHSAALNEDHRWFVANYAVEKESWRLTLTLNAINAARLVVVLVRGESKAERLRAVFTTPKDPWEMPIQAVSPINGEMIWLMDREAARLLPEDIA
ncbi:MAG: 6-phosphogluconolactonase [Anaerolineaceae bacterium]|nr:6-phosphogluconolactonase [Anaerolineaceae bacterium]